MFRFSFRNLASFFLLSTTVLLFASDSRAAIAQDESVTVTATTLYNVNVRSLPAIQNERGTVTQIGEIIGIIPYQSAVAVEFWTSGYVFGDANRWVFVVDDVSGLSGYVQVDLLQFSRNDWQTVLPLRTAEDWLLNETDPPTMTVVNTESISLQDRENPEIIIATIPTNTTLTLLQTGDPDIGFNRALVEYDGLIGWVSMWNLETVYGRSVYSSTIRRQNIIDTDSRAVNLPNRGQYLTAVSASRGLRLRRLPGRDSEIILQLRRWEPIVYFGYSTIEARVFRNWCYVESLESGAKGWVACYYITQHIPLEETAIIDAVENPTITDLPTQDAFVARIVATQAGINLRSVAEGGGTPVGNYNDIDVTVIGRDLYNRWYLVRTSDGVEGWIHQRWLTFDRTLVSEERLPTRTLRFTERDPFH